MTQRITGKVILHKSANRECLCCDGPHIFGYFLALAPYASPFPTHCRRDVDQWLHAVLDCKNLEGKTIEITARVVA